LDKITIIVVLPIVLIVVMMLIVPLPAPVLDTLIAVNLLFALAIIITVFCGKKAAAFSLLPFFLPVYTIFGLTLNIAATRLILTKGAAFDGLLIRFVSRLFAGGESGHLVAGFTLFLLFITVQLTVIPIAFGIVEKAAKRSRDTLPEKQTAIDAEYKSGAITEEESIVRKNVLLREVSFYDAMDTDCGFISISEDCRLVIIAITVLGGLLFHSIAKFFTFNGFPGDKRDIPGVFIGMVSLEEGIPGGSAFGILLSAEKLIDAVKIYIPLVIGNGVLSMLPSLLIAIAVWRIVKKRGKTMEGVLYV